MSWQMRALLIFNVLLGLLAIFSEARASTPDAGAAPAVVVAAPAPQRPNLTASVGGGYGYGVIGMQLRNDRSVRPWLHLAPFVAGGLTPGFGWTSFVGAFGVSAGLG